LVSSAIHVPRIQSADVYGEVNRRERVRQVAVTELSCVAGLGSTNRAVAGARTWSRIREWSKRTIWHRGSIAYPGQSIKPQFAMGAAQAPAQKSFRSGKPRAATLDAQQSELFNQPKGLQVALAIAFVEAAGHRDGEGKRAPIIL